jgi:flagellar biosynthesis/type III secretory pathway M-ring protein FliF/YscJ
MRNAFSDLFAQLKGIWARLDAGQRLVVGAVTLATLVGLGAIVWFAGQPSYETVYTARNLEEIDTVRQALQSNGVAFREGDGGRSFQVERNQVSKAQMAIAGSGITEAAEPGVGGGLSLIEDNETKQWKLDAASRQACAAAIQKLDGVAQVTVTASRPRRIAAFRDRDHEQRASATVMLKLKPGASFEGLARAASALTSSQLMVPQANIEVVSAAGNQRWRYDPDREASGGSSEFLALERRLSEERTRMAQDRLDQMWPGKTSVSVNVTLDPSWEVRSERVLPTEALVRSEKVKKDETKPGTAKAGEGDAGSSKNETRDREFVTEIGERRTGKLMPDIRRMTVAVLYDRSLEQSQGFAKDDLMNAVKAIVGWDPARDKPDAFSTLVGEFAPIEMEVDVATGPGFAEVALRWGPTVGQILGVFVVVMFLRGLFKRGAGAAASAGDVGGSAPTRKNQVDEANLSPEEQQRRMRKEIEHSIATDPAALAKLLEAWLAEQKA